MSSLQEQADRDSALMLIQGQFDRAWIDTWLGPDRPLHFPQGLEFAKQHALVEQHMLIARPTVKLGRQQFRSAWANEAIDINAIDPARRWADFGMIAFDMDSTLITIECIDEMAKFAGCGAEVAAITEAAMRGEISDYDESLRQRVKLLKGQSLSIMKRLIEERLVLSPGVAKFTHAARERQLKMIVLSGGFHPIVDEVASMIQADACCANRLGEEQGYLDGSLIGPIVNAQAKAQYLKDFASQWGVEMHQTIAIGDGANDLAMMATAGLSACWRAKPLVAERADLSFLGLGLDAMLEHFEETRSPALTQALHSLQEGRIS